MNDFSKEELQLILKGMSQYYLEKDSLELMDKIQSMIDNYCEHPESYRYTFDEEFSYCDKCKCMWNVKNDNQ